VAQLRLERHLHTLGALWMAIGGLFLIPVVGLMVFGRGLHLMLHEREPWPGFFQLLLYVAGSTLVILAAGGAVRGTRADAEVSLGSDGGHHPWSAGAFPSAIRDRAGRVFVVGSAGG